MPQNYYEMYRAPSPGQLSFENFYLPFGGKLRHDNRWVILAGMIPWEDFEVAYAEQFSQKMGALPTLGMNQAGIGTSPNLR